MQGYIVKVNTPVVYDADLVSAVLDDAVLPLDHADRVLAPFITIDGNIHGPTSDFLRRHCRHLTTARRIASELAAWLKFLCNTCNFTPFDDHRDPVLVAGPEHSARYYRQCQYGTDDQVLTPAGWEVARSAIKRFYEYMELTYQHPPPFEIRPFTHRSGYSGTTIVGYQPRRRNVGSAGTPLTPEFAELLLMGALRIDPTGRQDSYRAADRDHAILSLGLGTGLRRNNLANITTYEIAPVSALPVTTMRVADRITKGDAGGEALAFSHRLRSVHQYIAGARKDATGRNAYAPSDPLEIVDANPSSVRYVTRSTGEVTSSRWSDLTDIYRRRLVNADNTSPILFLNEYTGAPLAYSSFQHAVDGARDFAREHINPDFPVNFRLHDLRHTYAVHMTVAILCGVIADQVAANRRDDWTVDHVVQAVELVKDSLGHASDASTRLYVQTAYRFLDIDIRQFFGDL